MGRLGLHLTLPSRRWRLHSHLKHIVPSITTVTSLWIGLVMLHCSYIITVSEVLVNLCTKDIKHSSLELELSNWRIQ